MGRESQVMNSLTEAKEFDKIECQRTHTRRVPEDTCRQRCPWSRHADIVVEPSPKTIPGIWEDLHRMQ